MPQIPFTFWQFLAVGSALVFAARVGQKKIGWKEAEVGVLLAVIDFIVEFSGEALGLWKSAELFSLLGVPAFITFVCFFGGSLFASIIPEKKKHQILLVLVVGITATFFEFWLRLVGILEYINWNTLFCFISYIIVFGGLAAYYRWRK